MKTTLITALFLALVSAASAGNSTESDRLSMQLAELTGVQEMFASYLQQCTEPNSGYDPKAIYKVNPSFFGGVSPQSAYWPEVETLYREYQRRMCQYLTPEDFARFYADYYAKVLSEQELKAAVVFFTSPAGESFSLANQGVNSEFQKYAQCKMRELYKDSFAEINARLLDISRKYKEYPK